LPPAEGRDSRVLVIPAAGTGSRLKSTLPKVLVPVLGRAMIDRLIDVYEPYVKSVVVVTNPVARAAVTQHLDARGLLASVVVQEQPTGMLDAITIAHAAVGAGVAAHVWITWCDQVGVHPLTVARLAERTQANPAAPIVMPTCTRPDPYIHLLRDSRHRITRVLQRREGDAMPAIGESDMGLFSLSRRAFLDDLHRYATMPMVGEGTGERNFLPFIPWMDRQGGVLTFPCVDAQESTGVNTPEELAFIEHYLRARS